MLLVTAQLESLYICISLDYLMTLQDFFVSGLPSAPKPQIEQSTSSNQSQTKVSTATQATKGIYSSYH